MDRSNHYENAFEAYLQQQRLCYIAVDETRRSPLGPESIKSLDFVVFADNGARLVVDVKGRRFPAGPPHRPRRVWECWSTRDDVEGLERWTQMWGPPYQGLLVFIYHILPCVQLADDTEDLWTWRGRRYLLRAIAVEDYHQHMRVRSPRWGTMTLPNGVYRQLVRPLSSFTQTKLAGSDWLDEEDSPPWAPWELEDECSAPS
jgi:hypothetical protein